MVTKCTGVVSMEIQSNPDKFKFLRTTKRLDHFSDLDRMDVGQKHLLGLPYGPALTAKKERCKRTAKRQADLKRLQTNLTGCPICCIVSNVSTKKCTSFSFCQRGPSPLSSTLNSCRAHSVYTGLWLVGAHCVHTGLWPVGARCVHTGQ